MFHISYHFFEVQSLRLYLFFHFKEVIYIVILNTVSDADVHSVPQFIRNRLSFLLSVFEDTSLEKHGSILIPVSEDDLSNININAVEFTEKIICDNTVYWHLTVPKSNSFCEEIFLDEALMSNELIEECEAGRERTVHDYEL